VRSSPVSGMTARASTRVLNFSLPFSRYSRAPIFERKISKSAAAAAVVVQLASLDEWGRLLGMGINYAGTTGTSLPQNLTRGR